MSEALLPRRFAFVANVRPIWTGSLGGVALLALIYGWAQWTGRFQADAPVVVILIASFTLVPPFAIWRQLVGYRRAAAALGGIEVDEQGVRWRQPSGALGFDVPWGDVERATVDSRNRVVLLSRRQGGPAVIGAVTELGVPSGSVILERFDEVVALLGKRVAMTSFEGAKAPQAARRTLGLAALGCGSALGLYLANRALERAVDWHRCLLPMPIVIGCVGLLYVVAGIRVAVGRGPMLSPVYGKGLVRRFLLFIAVTVAANFVLVAIVNWSVLQPP